MGMRLDGKDVAIIFMDEKTKPRSQSQCVTIYPFRSLEQTFFYSGKLSLD